MHCGTETRRSRGFDYRGSLVLALCVVHHLEHHVFLNCLKVEAYLRGGEEIRRAPGTIAPSNGETGPMK